MSRNERNSSGISRGIEDRSLRQRGHAPSESRSNLLFPPEHGLCQLWRLWDHQVGEKEWLRISLSPPEDGKIPISKEKMEKEKRWVQILLDHVATARIAQVFPDGRGPVDQDEAAVVFPSSDELVAWLLLLPPVGTGKTLTVSEIQKALPEHGVIYGVDWNTLCNLSGCAQRYFQLFRIAVSKPPIPGQDGRVEDCYSRDLVPEVQLGELEQPDYHVLNLEQPIEEGDVICRIIPPTRGMPGRTVTGKVIPAPPGREAVVPQGRNTQISSDGTCLVAQRKGHLNFTGYYFQVKPVWEVSEEELENKEKINFLGDIHIHGDVREGVFICASGNIQIDGVLETCTVQAGENIVLASGVQGRDHATLQAQKSVYAKYMEHCQVFARENVYADCLINCQVYANGSVYVRTGRGTLIGGTVQAACEVSANTVGSKAECSTQVFLGGKPCEQAERAYISQEIQAKERELAELEADSPQGAEQRKAKLRLHLCVARMKLEKMDKEMDLSQQEYMSDDGERLVCDMAYPGTVVTIGHSSLTITGEQRKCTVSLVDGEVTRC